MGCGRVCGCSSPRLSVAGPGVPARRRGSPPCLLTSRPAPEWLRAVWAHCESEGVEDPGAFPVAPDLVEALVELGELDEARSVSARLAELAESQAHPWGLASAKRCGAFIELTSEVYDTQAADQLAEAVMDYEQMGLRFDAARALLALGRVQRRLKKWGAARARCRQP